MLRPGGLSVLYTLRTPPLFCARAPPPPLTVISTPIRAASQWRLRGISVSPIRFAWADLFVFRATSSPYILRIPGWSDVIFSPWGFPRQRKFDRSRPADSQNAKTLRHVGLEL